MVAAVMGDLASIGGGIIKKILGAFGILAFAVGLYYLVKWIQKGTKKQKSFTITAIIVDMNGVIELDMLAFIKSDESGMLEMIFKDRKADSVPPIPKHFVKNGNVVLVNYAPGHYCVVDPSKTIHNLNTGVGGIEVVSLGMKKYITAKQRELLNKAEAKKYKWEQYAPWITLGIAVACAVLLTAFLFFIGTKIEAKNIAERIIECGAVI